MGRPGFDWRSGFTPSGHPGHFDPHMGWGWRPYRRFGFGRRFFWFGFGAFAAMAWARHHGSARMGVEGERARGEWDGGWHGCRRVEYTPRLVPEDDQREKHRRWGWWDHSLREQLQQQAQGQPPQYTYEMPAPAPAAAATTPPSVTPSVPVQAVLTSLAPTPSSPPAGTTIPVVEQQWETDMRNLTRQASDRVTEMSEATIDSLVLGLQGLKTRLAEHRADTQKRLAEEERKRQEARQAQPPRLV